MSRRRVVVTGLGLVSPFGEDLADFFARLCAGESAISRYTTTDRPRPLDMPAVHCAGFDADARLGRPLAGSMDRYAQLGMAAAQNAWSAAGLEANAEAREDWGVAWGTALGGTLAYERGYRELWCEGRERVHPLSVVLGMNNAAASHIAIRYKLGGACTTHTVACASAAIAIGEAFRRVRAGEAPVVLAGGSDAPLAYGVVRAWEALRVLAPLGEDASRACRPFSADRAGLVLGEGAAALVLEDWEHARTRGAHVHAELVGYGASCDHSHLVRPEPAGQVRAIEAALADGALDAAEIGYVNAHGTATREGDPAEVAALRRVFGERAASLPVSATKSMHGHLMGATGALEALITVLALEHGRLPPTARLAAPAEDCQGVDHILGTARGATPAAALSNAFAFGGSNAVLAFRRAEP